MIVSIGLIVLLQTYAPILLVIIRIVMHVVDAISIIKIIKNKQNDVWTLYDFIGDIDCEIAIASYRESQDNWCRPELRDGALEVVKNMMLLSLIRQPSPSQKRQQRML